MPFSDGLLLAKLLSLALAVLIGDCTRRLCCSQRFNPVRIWQRNRAIKRQFDGPKPSNLLIGNTAEVSTGQKHRTIVEWANTYGPMYRIRLAWVNVVVISDPAVVAEVLHAKNFDKIPGAYGAVSKMMSNCGMPDLVSGRTDEWWRLFRKGLAPSFSPANIRSGFKHTLAACSELIEVLDRKIEAGQAHSVDMDRACLSETMDLISSFAFGLQLGALAHFERGDVFELADIMHRAEMEVETRIANPLRQWTWWMTAEGRRQSKLFSRFQGIIRQLLADMKQRLGPDPPKEDQSIGARMLRLRDPKTGQPMSDDRLLPHMGMIFFAGHDTSGHTMAWTLFYIATHPEVEAKITAELAEQDLLVAPGRPQRDLTFDDLSELPYLNAAIKESMRHRPVVATASIRTCQHDCTLGGGRYYVPAATGMWTPLVAIHNSKAVWGPDADVYRPERWFEAAADYADRSVADGDSGHHSGDDDNSGDEADSRQGATGHKAKRFIPFSDGRRNCIGQPLGKMNVTAVLAMLLGRFHFDLAPEMGGPEGVAAAEHMAMTLQPGGGLLMRVTRRDSMH